MKFFYEKYPELKGVDYIYLNPHGKYQLCDKAKGIPVDRDKFERVREDIHPILRLEYVSMAEDGTKNMALPPNDDELLYTGLSWEEHVIARGHPNVYEGGQANVGRK